MNNFIKNSNKYFALSIIIIVIGVIFLFINGIQLDTEFTGGTVISAKLNTEFTEQEVLELVKEVTDNSCVVQKTGNEGKGVMISFSQITDEDTTEIENKLKEKYGSTETTDQLENEETQEITSEGEETLQDTESDKYLEISTKVVEATYGSEIAKNTILAVVVALICMVVYIAVRFQSLGGIKSAISAIVGLIHNVLIVTVVYIIFKISINSAFIAAILTVIGYSINNTIVVYDRIRENRNLKEQNKKLNLEELVNTSIKQILGRTINTTVTSVATVAVLLGFAIYFGQTTLVEFTIPLIVGLIAGEYSSICISTPLWYKLENKK